MSQSEELIAAAYLVGYVVPTVAVAVRIARRWSDDPLDRWFLGVLLGVAQAVGVPLLLSMLGVLDRNTVLAGHLVLAAAVVGLVRRAPRDGEPVRRKASLGTLLAVGAGAGFATLSGIQSLAGQSLDFDSRNYHLPHLADWILSRSLWILPFQNPGAWVGAHPSNGEFLGLWLALPIHGDQLSLLSPVLFAVLGILAAGMLARELGGEAWVGASAGVAVFLVPILYASEIRALGTDNAAMAGMAAAAALIARAVKNGWWPWILAAGIGLGLGMGSKYTALLPGLALAIVGIVLLRQSRRWLLLLPGLVLFFVPWLIRNWIETGNPLFPREIKIAGVELFKGTDSATLRFSTTLLEHITHGRWTIVGRWLHQVAVQAGPAALLAVIGIAVGLRRGASTTTRLMSVVTLVAVVAYLATPFTGGGSAGDNPTLLFSIRYLMIAPLLGAGIAAALGRRGVSLVAALVVASLGYDAVRILQGTSFARRAGLTVSAGSMVVVAAVVGAVVLLAATGRWPPLRVASPTQSAMAAVLAVALAWAGAAAILHKEDTGYVPSALEQLVRRARGPHRVVEVIAVKDLRSVVGRRLDVTLLAPPIPSGARRDMPELLDASLRSTVADVLVVSSTRATGVPAGYLPPPNWCLFGRVRTESVYLRVPNAAAISGARAPACG